MSLLNQPCVITVSGKQHTGKSTALIRLINLFIKESCAVFLYDFKTKAFSQDPATSELAEHNDQRKQNGSFYVPSYLVYVELPCGSKYGIITFGDPNTNIDKWLNVLKSVGCDFFITATRTRGDTYNQAEAFAKANGFVFLPIKKNDDSFYTNTNLPEFLFELLK